MFLLKKGGKVSFLLILIFLGIQAMGVAQSEQPRLFAKLTLLKATEGKEKDFEAFVRESVKPLQVIRRQNGEMAFWIFFKVHFTGQADAYNYVGVGYYPTWANTEHEPLAELLKQSNPKADVAGFMRKQRELRTVVSESIFAQLNAVEPSAPVPARYVRIDYMKTKPGKQADYLDVERKDWIPLHQHLVSQGQSAGWGLWQVVFPAGTSSPYDYATSSRYGTYDQVLVADYEAIFRTINPSADVADIFNRTTQSRDLVKSELWEVLEIIN